MDQRQIDVIIEARMKSSRLPGKVMMLGCGVPLLQHQIERVRRIPFISKVIVATTTNQSDDCIAALAQNLLVACFRGDEHDVLGRVVSAAEHFNTEIIVQITGDNPLIDPIISSEVISAFIEHEEEVDLAVNDLEVTFPIGWNTRVFSRQFLQSVEREAEHPVDREHVVNYIYQRSNRYRFWNVSARGLYSRKEVRLTMDEPADYHVIKAVFESLYPRNPNFDALDILSFLDSHSELRDFNSHVVQRTYSYR